MHRDDATRDETLRVSSPPVSGEDILDPLRGEAATRGARHLAAAADERLDRLFHDALLSLLGKSAAAEFPPSTIHAIPNRSERAAMAEQSRWHTEATRLVEDRTAGHEQLT